MSRERLRRPRGNLTTRQKSAEGVIGHVVGKALQKLRLQGLSRRSFDDLES